MSAALHGYLAALGHGLAAGVAPGVLLGLLLGPARISGVDFRQWFRDPSQPSEISDDSWIGLMRSAAHVLSWAAILSLAIASAWLWFAPTCRPFQVSGLLELLADCLGFWARWVDLLGIACGVVAAQVVVEAVWRTGLRWVPILPIRILAKRPQPESPPAKPAPKRRLVVCCDGTWNWPDQTRETNVVRLLRAIRSEGEFEGKLVPQISYYHLGVGTGNFVDRIAGGGAGVGLSNSVKACYGFLVDNYTPDSEILLFGFSRGAYVVRSVAGLIGKVGMLQKPEMEHFIEVWDWYTGHRRDPAELSRLAPERIENIDIQCVGVWDTVGALGIPGTRFCAKAFAFHDTGLGPHVRHAFQALAIDERRGNFQAATWVPQRDSQQILEQVWFPGVHSNIGGGYEEHGLSDTTLVWMVSKIVQYHVLDLNIDFIDAVLDKSVPYPTGKIVNSRTFGWKLLGCPVPRRVGTTTSSENIHASAWDREAARISGDIYRSDRRKEWLKSMASSKIERNAFECKHDVKTRGAKAKAPAPRSRRLGLCDLLMEKIGGSA